MYFVKAIFLPISMFGWGFPHRIHVAIFKEENKIHVTHTKTELLFHDSKEIIICSGALETPSLLSFLPGIWMN